MRVVESEAENKRGFVFSVEKVDVDISLCGP